jgi:hypothetical protein
VQAQDEPSPRAVSVTVSPFHLLNPQLHVTGEVRLAPRVGAAAVLAAGRVTDEEETYRIWEAGGQLRYYLLGSFTQGMMIGVDVGHVDVNGQMANPMEYLVGTRAGGFIGYKITGSSGFTAEVQLGPVHVWGDGDTSEWQTLHNLKLGWSF